MAKVTNNTRAAATRADTMGTAMWVQWKSKLKLVMANTNRNLCRGRVEPVRPKLLLLLFAVVSNKKCKGGEGVGLFQPLCADRLFDAN